MASGGCRRSWRARATPAEQVRHGETGLVIDLEVPDALVDAMAILLAREGIRRRLAAAAHSRPDPGAGTGS